MNYSVNTSYKSLTWLINVIVGIVRSLLCKTAPMERVINPQGISKKLPIHIDHLHQRSLHTTTFLKIWIYLMAIFSNLTFSNLQIVTIGIKWISNLTSMMRIITESALLSTMTLTSIWCKLFTFIIINFYSNQKKLQSLMSGNDLHPLEEEVSKEEDDSICLNQKPT